MKNHLALSAFLALASSSTASAAEPVWFEVASTDPSVAQSYLLPITRADFVEEARQLLAQSGGNQKVVVARIRAGGDGLNRNLRSDDQALWSWHVAEFLTFGDLAIELCDGSPQLVEDAPIEFAQNTGETICFWGYSLVAELSEPPAMTINDDLNGFWHAPGSEGTGFSIEVFEAFDSVGLSWNRYAPIGGPTPVQQWLVGAGPITSVDNVSHAAITLATPVLPQAVTELGTSAETAVPVTLKFSDCNHAVLQIHDTIETTLPLVRTVRKFNCGPDR